MLTELQSSTKMAKVPIKCTLTMIHSRYYDVSTDKSYSSISTLRVGRAPWNPWKINPPARLHVRKPLWKVICMSVWQRCTHTLTCTPILSEVSCKEMNLQGRTCACRGSQADCPIAPRNTIWGSPAASWLFVSLCKYCKIIQTTLRYKKELLVVFHQCVTYEVRGLWRVKILEPFYRKLRPGHKREERMYRINSHFKR